MLSSDLFQEGVFNMCTTSPRSDESTAIDRPLFVALELSTAEWRLAFTTGLSEPIAQRVIPAGDRERLRRVLAEAKRRVGLAATAPVHSCYEAGRDAFWPHRLLAAEGVANVVVDSASIEVSRRARRAKTDRLDARKLVTMLVRWRLGERQVWHVVHVPAPDVEAARQVPRTRDTLTQERTRWRNRIHAALATVGVRLRITATFPARLETATQWDGTPVPAAVRQRVLVAWRLLQQIEEERRTLARTLQAERRAARAGAAATVRRLTQLRGIGERFAWMLATEVCSRDLRNRRQVGALTGFTATPYASGTMARDQGISRAGLAAVRRMAVETAWVWVQWQPASALTQWYVRRFGRGGPGPHRVGIVAVARKLVIALWRYAREGTVPAGAVLRTGAA
jgi:transposase